MWFQTASADKCKLWVSHSNLIMQNVPLGTANTAGRTKRNIWEGLVIFRELWGYGGALRMCTLVQLHSRLTNWTMAGEASLALAWAVKWHIEHTLTDMDNPQCTQKLPLLHSQSCATLGMHRGFTLVKQAAAYEMTCYGGESKSNTWIIQSVHPVFYKLSTWTIYQLGIVWQQCNRWGGAA